jgi:tRNA(Ile2) C34 agmatinyltransferase TiaS
MSRIRSEVGQYGAKVGRELLRDRAACPVCGDEMGTAVVDGYGVLLFWCPKCRRAVDDETLRRELASRRSCLRKMR